MEFVKIGNYTYDVIVTEISENFNILYGESTGRTISDGARMTLDPIGTFYGHKVTFKRRQGREAEFDRLFDYISQPRYDGIPVEIVHNQTTLAYEAYVSSGERALKRIDPTTNKIYWDSLSINFIPMEAQVKPL